MSRSRVSGSIALACALIAAGGARGAGIVSAASEPRERSPAPTRPLSAVVVPKAEETGRPETEAVPQAADVSSIYRLIPPSRAAELLVTLPPAAAALILTDMPPEAAGRILAEIDDEAASVLTLSLMGRDDEASDASVVHHFLDEADEASPEAGPDGLDQGEKLEVVG